MFELCLVFYQGFRLLERYAPFLSGHLLISSLHRLHQIAILLEILFLFFCTAACPSGWCSCCCGCCTLHLENGLVANGDDDGVGVPVGAVGSLNLHLSLLACRPPLPLLHGLLPFLLKLPTHLFRLIEHLSRITILPFLSTADRLCNIKELI